ncbi:MAG: hypothetical protein RL071_1160 [Pseudomonadota bacterium]
MPAALPGELIRTLSFHGAVELRAGLDAAAPAFERAQLAPFDDRLVLFLRPGGPVLAGLARDSALELQARDPAGTYSMRLLGRAWPTVSVARAPNRSALEPWLPEGGGGHALICTDYYVDHIEMSLGAGEARQRFFGPVPGAPPPRRGLAAVRWLRVGLSGVGGVGAAISALAAFVWLGVQGAEFPGRPFALTAAVLTGAAGAIGGKNVQQAIVYASAAAGRAPHSLAAPLLDAGLAPLRARDVGLALLVMHVLGLAVLGAVWSPDLALLTLGGALAWLSLPAAALHHLSAGRASGPKEPR